METPNDALLAASWDVDPSLLGKLGQAIADRMREEMQLPGTTRLAVEHQQSNPNKSPLECLQFAVEESKRLQSEANARAIAHVEQFLGDIAHNKTVDQPKVNVSCGDPESNVLHVDIEIPAHLLARHHFRHDGFMGYFDNHVEHPRGIAFNPLPVNTYWEYVSSTFLNGFINYVSIVDAQLLNRYHPMDDLIESEYLESYQEPPRSLKWTKPSESMTKQQAYDLYTQKGRLCHTRIGCFRDDVIVLTTCDNDAGKTMYMVFWFDMDCSDCGIGRFVTDDPQDIVIASFRAWVAGLDYGCSPLPEHFFTGWCSF